jgi:hypothetical protein
MAEPDHDAQDLRRLVLGTLPEDERAALEERLLEDEDLYLRAVLAEDEIADELAEGRLDPAERTALLAAIARSPALRERMEHSAALHAVLGRTARAARPAVWARFGPALAAGLAVAALSGLWSHVQMQELRSELAVAASERDAARAAEAHARETAAAEQQERGRLLPAAREPDLAVFSLASGTRSESGPPVLRVPAPPGWIVLQVEGDGTAGERRALVRTVRGEQVFADAKPALGTTGGLGVVTVRVPARLLTDGSYEVVLEGRSAGGAWETVGISAFKAVRAQ